MQRISTGIKGFDRISKGGLISDRVYLLVGGPGTGKTTFSLEFLEEAATDQLSLYITFEESAAEIKENASIRNWDLKGIEFLDLSPEGKFFVSEDSYDIFSPVEAEKDTLIAAIVEKIEEKNPTRVVIDSATQLKFLLQDKFQYRKKLLSLISYLRQQSCTTLLISENDLGRENASSIEAFSCQGVIEFKSYLSNKNRLRRTISISKFRGSDFISGEHEYQIEEQGFVIYPRLVKNKSIARHSHIKVAKVSSGIPGLEQMLHGGLDRAGISLITGHTGVGKTTLAINYIKQALFREEKCLIYLYEEDLGSLTTKLEGINIPFEKMLESEQLLVREIDPIQNSSDQMAALLQKDVESFEPELMMLDSLNSYLISVEPATRVQSCFYELTQYLKSENITAIFTSEISDILGDLSLTDHGFSYLVDSIIFIRYVEEDAEMIKAINIFKKRMSSHEKVMRRFEITKDGIQIGEVFSNLQGILGGTPVDAEEQEDFKS